MTKLPLSPAASALLRALIVRSGAPNDRILLMEAHSTEWQSLTFEGERHRFELRIADPDSQATREQICEGLEDAEFDIPGLIVADIAVAEMAGRSDDGALELTIEALTVEAD